MFLLPHLLQVKIWIICLDRMRQKLLYLLIYFLYGSHMLIISASKCDASSTDELLNEWVHWGIRCLLAHFIFILNALIR